MKISTWLNGLRNLSAEPRFFIATLLAIPLQANGISRQRTGSVSEKRSSELCLYAPTGQRKYLNVQERRRFLETATEMPPRDRLFCSLLLRSGGRISEVLAVTPAAIDLDGGTVILRTLKRRQASLLRRVPLPRSLLRDLERVFDVRARQRDRARAVQPLWHWDRTTAWRRVKAAMARAKIHGAAATPKGLRHSFGVAAFQAKVPAHIVQRWLGHASVRTTAIYGDVMGSEERAFAARMWRVSG